MKSVVINPAGGGTDTGVSGNGLVEKNVSLEISNIIKNILESKGIDVYMLRNGDETISYDNRIKNLKKKYPNGKDVIVLSNTLNSGGGSGIEIVYSLNNKDTLASKLAKNLSYFNNTKYYQLRSPSDTTKDYYYITRNTPGYETVIVRFGYADNSKDAGIIKNNIEEIATSVADAIMDYIGVHTEEGTYTVKSGDTLYSIAKKFNVTVNELKALNNLSSNTINLNQVLKIPNSSTSQVPTESNTYTVKSGDTLYAIAKKYNTSVDAIKKLNNMTSNSLRINQVLKIPVSSVKTYKVVSGDTLYGIAKKYNTSVDAIKKLNNLTSNALSIGQILYIP